MKEYHKIPTLYKFNNETKKYDPEFTSPELKYLAPLPWLGSEKVDGPNIRVHWGGHHFEFGGRTDNAQLPKEVVALLDAKFDYDMEIYFEQTFGQKEVMLYMEAYGGKIQTKAGYGGSERLIGYDMEINGYMLYPYVADEIFNSLGINTVTRYLFNNLSEAIAFVEKERVSELANTPMEGVVCVPVTPLYNRDGERIIVKIKTKDLKKRDFEKFSQIS